ncbi:hypothetical protein TIFTF001_012709 [Ficus carica]|uniref:Uncharacterized protein n=1 Tax=Ficus carica TaxID=3494 RepID=A0AA88A2V7_FICCA|nr:hypothetical protein TIFTF001_012709 [Ficus carica]
MVISSSKAASSYVKNAPVTAIKECGFICTYRRFYKLTNSLADNHNAIRKLSDQAIVDSGFNLENCLIDPSNLISTRCSAGDERLSNFGRNTNPLEGQNLEVQNAL